MKQLKKKADLIKNLAKNGLDIKQIAKFLSISRQAVEYHLKKISEEESKENAK